MARSFRLIIRLSSPFNVASPTANIAFPPILPNPRTVSPEELVVGSETRDRGWNDDARDRFEFRNRAFIVREGQSLRRPQIPAYRYALQQNTAASL